MDGTHIMVDLETLGTGNDALILSIGAVKFTPTEIVDSFHVGIDPVSAQQAGLKIDAATVMWWFDPERAAAREALLGLERVDLGSALLGFRDWCGDDDVTLWGNGATFDNVILRGAFAAMRFEYPAKFWNDLCFRTLKRLAPDVKVEREGTHHDALDDATYQARLWQAIYARLGAPVPVLS